MPQKSGFFDTTADDPREYPAREFAEYFSRFVGNGVFSGGTKLKVNATGNDANVRIELGYAWINGYMYSVFDTPLILPIAPATTQDRIDRVILRLDTSTPVRAVQAMVIQGLPGASPTPPAIVRSGDIYDLSLAQVRIKANSSIVLPENITDERLNNAVCGLVTGLVQQADTTTIFNQFQSWLNTKTAEYQQQWQDFLKGVQDEGFASTQYVDQVSQTKANAAETNAKNYVDGKPWQKHKVSVDDGAAIDISGQNLDNILLTGFYKGNGMLNAPALSAGWGYVEVIRHAETWVLQKVYDLHADRFYMRRRTDGGWTAWTQDLFTSVANGKQAIATAISGKGVAASGSDEFAVLANKISQIQTSSYRRTYYNVSSGSLNTGRDVRRRITLADLGVVKDMLITDSFTLTANISGQNYTNSYVESVVEIHNTAGQIITVYTNRVGSTEGPTYLDAYTTLLNIALNLRNRTGFCVRQFDYTSTRAYDFIVPANFDTSLPLSLVASFFFYVGYGSPNATYSASINGNIAFA